MKRDVFVSRCSPGHVGRANELAGYFAKILGALPIITTATDLNGLFAVDVFAQKNELVLTDRAKAKAISAALLSGRRRLFSPIFRFGEGCPRA